MDQGTSYRTVKGPASVELVINKSRFIGQCFPISTESEALEKLAALRKQYWDATHNCYAYSVGKKGEIARFSDDGEPGGTAGMPMMDALRGGGLVRAYSKSCSEAIRAAGVVRMTPCDFVEFHVPYHQWAMFQQEARKQGVALGPEYGEMVRCIAAIEAEKTKSFMDAVYDQSAGSLTGQVIDREYRPLEDHEEG